ncbi:harmonin-like isoform X3 [Mizuhopecten yessoensis]|uniref:harmonin-like isoform X3 n=1 Tax=Mizuhopecten yessoensis TaxID=6573 RepID=UPI000B45AB92|nr:harmonin-like isoform X3 [Mizuhopecten yessoensis]
MTTHNSLEENYVVKRFIQEVNDLVPVKDRDVVFDALKRYKSSTELQRLVQDLKTVLDDPLKMEVFEFVRPLIPAKHQMEFDRLAPTPPGRGRRIINLRRRTNESLGFAVRGGFEHGIGVFVSHVEAGSQAERQGLRVGDEIVRVNGYTISQAIHEEVLNLIKGRDAVELKVTNIGMLPVKEKQGDSLTWKYVEKRDRKKSVQRKSQQRPASEDEGEVVKLFANLRTSPSLGCSIMSGPHGQGIYIQRVGPQSLGEQIGLEVGDQILEVNGISFLDVAHNEAIVALKSSKELNLVIRKKSGIHIVQSAAVNTRTQPPKEPPKQESSLMGSQYDEEPEYAVVVKEKKAAAPPAPPPAPSAPAPPPPPPPPPFKLSPNSQKQKKRAPPPPPAPQPSLDFREELHRVNLKRQAEREERKDEDEDTLEGDDSFVEDHSFFEMQDQRPDEEQTPYSYVPIETTGAGENLWNQDVDVATRLEKILQQKQANQRQAEERQRLESDILRGRGGPLRKADLGLVGPTSGFTKQKEEPPLSPTNSSGDDESTSSEFPSPISDIDDYIVEKANGNVDVPGVTDVDSFSLSEKLPYTFIH